MTQLSVESPDFERFSRALRSAADDELGQRMQVALIRAAKPVGREAVAKGSKRMPRRGGFADLAARSKVRVVGHVKSGDAQVALELAGAVDLASLDAGILHHPVFARSGENRTWVSQRVPGRTYSTALRRAAPEVEHKVGEAVQGVLADVARKA